MKIFQGYNPAGPPCPVCKTRFDGETILVPKPKPASVGNRECVQMHTECAEVVLTGWLHEIEKAP
jgi:hypothetical protein